MSKVFAANVFLSSSKDVIDKLFFGKSKLKTTEKILSSLTQEEINNSLLVTPNINPGLIDMDFNFNSEVADTHVLSLRFLETNSGFEAKYIESNVSLAMLKRLAADSSFDANLSYGSLNDIHYIYFSFGIGSNLKDWAGPYRLFLKTSNIIIDSNGSKIVELVFQSHGKYMQTNNITDSEIDSIATSFNRYNRFLTAKSLGDVNATTLLTYEDIKLKHAFDTGPRNINQIIYELISRYISLISRSKNVIVLLPDLQKLYDSELDNALKNAKRTRDSIPTSELGNPIFTTSELGLRAASVTALRTFLSKVGIDLYENIEKFDLGELKIIKEESTKIYSDGKDKNRRANFLPPIVEQNQEAQARILKMYGDRYELSVTNSQFSEFSQRVVRDYYVPLQVIGDSIKKALNVTSQINLREEINVNLISLWKEKGYINNDLENVYIFGVKELIDNTLYCQGISKFDDIFNKSITKPVSIYPFNPTTGYKVNPIFVGDQEYASKYFDMFLKDQINSSFGENVLQGDELSLDNPKRETINKLGIPIFKHNFGNSNVISLEVKFLDNLVNMYDFAFKEEAKLDSVNLNLEKVLQKEKLPIGEYTFYQVKNEVEKQVKSVFGPQSNNSFEGLVGNVYSILTNLNSENNIKRLLYKNNPKEFDKINIANFAILLAGQIYFNGSQDKPFVKVRDISEAISIRNSLNDYLSRTAASVSVKTLPFFKLSGSTAIGKTVAVFSRKNTIIGSPASKGLQEFSGLYTILGNRHVVNSSECYSEFQLVKPAISDTSVDYNAYLESSKEKRGFDTSDKYNYDKTGDILDLLFK